MCGSLSTLVVGSPEQADCEPSGAHVPASGSRLASMISTGGPQGTRAAEPHLHEAMSSQPKGAPLHDPENDADDRDLPRAPDDRGERKLPCAVNQW